MLFAVFGTALLSGVFGMAGGVLLLVILSLRLPLPQAMVLHGAAQLVANGSRALISRQFVQGAVLGPYAVGAGLAVVLAVILRLKVDTASALILTGLIPLLEPVLFRLGLPAVDRGRGAILCGASVTSLHLTAGATGPLLDVFFLRTNLTRHQVVATKATTQCLGHLLKMLYFGELAGALPGDWLIWSLLVPVSVAGTWCGRLLLDRLGETHFRKGTRAVVLAVGALSLVRGLLVWRSS